MIKKVEIATDPNRPGQPKIKKQEISKIEQIKGDAPIQTEAVNGAMEYIDGVFSMQDKSKKQQRNKRYFNT